MATPHNAAKIGEIAKTVLLPGDPLRAKVIADTFLEDPVQFNTVRNMFGFTGTYKGKAVSVMGTGMGIPSIGIYSHELIHVYGVQNLIRIGSCGAITDRVKIGDIVMAQGACTDSNYAYQYGLHGTFSAIADFGLLSAAVDAAKAHGFPYAVGNVNSTDIFYNELPTWKDWAKMGCLASEMETYALYCNAARAGVRALGIFTVSDSLVTGEETTAQERQNNFTNMMEVALDVAAQL
ncbi:MAG: purine-nucleoside phosphorylase [Sarcina sp.]|nr:purine-nucleoside phosphorylase [Sarcina sp.]